MSKVRLNDNEKKFQEKNKYLIPKQATYFVEPLTNDETFGVVIRKLDIVNDVLSATNKNTSEDGATKMEVIRQHLNYLVRTYKILVFKEQFVKDDEKQKYGKVEGNRKVMSAVNLLQFAKLFGSGEIHSAHRVHPKCEHKDVFRVSNNPEIGCYTPNGLGSVGWHNDGSFMQNGYSHAVYQIVETPQGGNTQYAHLVSK